jgi:hypothetical protein
VRGARVHLLVSIISPFFHLSPSKTTVEIITPCAAAAFGPMFGAWLERQCPNPSSCLPPSALNTTPSPLLGLRMVRASDAGTLAFLRSRHPQLSMCDRCRARSLLSSSPRAWLARDVSFSPPTRAHANDSSLSILSIHRDHEGWMTYEGYILLRNRLVCYCPWTKHHEKCTRPSYPLSSWTKHMLIESTIFFDP